MEESIRGTLPGIAQHGKLGGAQEEYWKNRYAAQEERLKGIAEKVPFFRSDGGEHPRHPARDRAARQAGRRPGGVLEEPLRRPGGAAEGHRREGPLLQI